MAPQSPKAEAAGANEVDLSRLRPKFDGPLPGDKELWPAFKERVELFNLRHGLKEPHCTTIFLEAIHMELYKLVRDIVFPVPPKDKN